MTPWCSRALPLPRPAGHEALIAGLRVGERRGMLTQLGGAWILPTRVAKTPDIRDDKQGMDCLGGYAAVPEGEARHCEPWGAYHYLASLLESYCGTPQSSPRIRKSVPR